jgi:hypothetical protein
VDTVPQDNPEPSHDARDEPDDDPMAGFPEWRFKLPEERP